MRHALVALCLAALTLLPATLHAQQDPPSEGAEAAEDIADGIQTFVLVMEIAAAVGVAAAAITNVVYIATDEPMPLAGAIGTGLLGLTAVGVGAAIVEDEHALGGTLLGLGVVTAGTAIWAAVLPEPTSSAQPDVAFHVAPAPHGASIWSGTARWHW